MVMFYLLKLTGCGQKGDVCKIGWFGLQWSSLACAETGRLWMKWLCFVMWKLTSCDLSGAVILESDIGLFDHYHMHNSLHQMNNLR